MEYIPGGNLYKLVKSPEVGPLRVPDAARYLKVLDALAAGLVHRDLKPSNLMIALDGDAKILDPGLARAMGENSPLTRPNAVIGTLDYASPEQRMVAPEPLEQVARGVPAAFAAIVRKLMAKDLDDRYQGAEALRADLARWTDPARVKAIAVHGWVRAEVGFEPEVHYQGGVRNPIVNRSSLGAEAARAFRPPPPELDDEDLHLLDDSMLAISGSLSLLALVAPEPRSSAHSPPSSRLVDPDDSPWPIRFIVAICLIGLLAIMVISLLR